MSGPSSIDFETVCRHIRATGLAPRGGFHPEPDDGVPELAAGGAAGTVVLVGNVGPEAWLAFRASAEAREEGDPLDAWSRRVVGELAGRLGAEALFPFGGPPYLPFVRWAQRAEPVYPSPIGPLIHPDYGLWHAYRGALAFAERMALPPPDGRPRPCDECAERPCLHTCPVEAFSESGYDVPACTRHIASPAGEACLTGGCLARRACPVGAAYRYAPAQAEFHMRAFLAANRRRN